MLPCDYCFLYSFDFRNAHTLLLCGIDEHGGVAIRTLNSIPAFCCAVLKPQVMSGHCCHDRMLSLLRKPGCSCAQVKQAKAALARASQIASNLIGQRVWIKWPYLQEAEIQAVSDVDVKVRVQARSVIVLSAEALSAHSVFAVK